MTPTGPSDVELFDRPGRDPVELSEPDPGWADAARRWADAVRAALMPLPAVVEHIGSTAVPGLVAKPVLDLQVAVPDIDDEDAYRPGLESLGLVLREREPEHRFFRPPAGEPRVVHVHVCAQASAWERAHLLFRDYLRAHPHTASAYTALKRDLAERYRDDRLAYTEAKTAIVRRVLDDAQPAD